MNLKSSRLETEHLLRGSNFPMSRHPTIVFRYIYCWRIKPKFEHSAGVFRIAFIMLSPVFLGFFPCRAYKPLASSLIYQGQVIQYWDCTSVSAHVTARPRFGRFFSHVQDWKELDLRRAFIVSHVPSLTGPEERSTLLRV
jgi:hypothetical protein